MVAPSVAAAQEALDIVHDLLVPPSTRPDLHRLEAELTSRGWSGIWASTVLYFAHICADPRNGEGPSAQAFAEELDKSGWVFEPVV